MKKVLKVLEFFVSILLVLNCRSIYVHTMYKNYRLNEILLIFLIVALFLKILMKDFDRSRVKRVFIYLFLYYLYSILFMLLNNIISIKNYVMTFIMAFPLFFTYYYISKDSKEIMLRILKDISNIMTIIAVISIFMYFLGPILNLIKSNENVYIYWGRMKKISSYYGIHFITQNITVFNHTFPRNTSIFTEAPMYSLNLTIALAIQLFIIDEKKLLKKIILVFAIITTISTTGIVLITIMIVYKIIIAKKNKIIRILKYLTFPIIIALSIFIIVNSLTEKSQTQSWDIRVDDYKACFSAWKDNVVFGCGYGNDDAIARYMSSFRSHSYGLSNSILVLLAQCGLFLFSLYFIALYNAFLYANRTKNKNILMFTLIMLILFITTIFTYNVMLVNLLAMCYVLNSNKNDIQYEK